MLQEPFPEWPSPTFAPTDQRGWRVRLRDWWRGFTDDDLASAQEKSDRLKHAEPNMRIEFSDAEWRAHLSVTRLPKRRAF